jgi:hypothetical protein
MFGDAGNDTLDFRDYPNFDNSNAPPGMDMYDDIGSGGLGNDTYYFDPSRQNEGVTAD